MIDDNVIDIQEKKNLKNSEFIRFKKLNGNYIWEKFSYREFFILDINKKLIERFIRDNVKYKNNNIFINDYESHVINGLNGYFKNILLDIISNYRIYDVVKNKEAKVDLSYLLSSGAFNFKRDFQDKCLTFLQDIGEYKYLNEKKFNTKEELLTIIEKHFNHYFSMQNLLTFIKNASLFEEYVFEEFASDCQIANNSSISLIEEFNSYFNIKQWLDLFQLQKPKQYNFFIRLVIAQIFNLGANEIDHPFNSLIYHRRLHIAIGGNRSGKGTLANLISLFPNCTPVIQANIQEAKQEYKKQEIFKENTALIVDGEFKLDEKTDISIVNEFKKALRKNETNTIRRVGTDASQIDYKGSYYICINPPIAEEKNALERCYEYFSTWVAYDRFDIVYIDWSYDKKLWKTFNFLQKVIENGDNDLKIATGSSLLFELVNRIWQYNEDIDQYYEEIQKSKLCDEYYNSEGIPNDYQSNFKFNQLQSVDKKIKNIIDLFVKYEKEFIHLSNIKNKTEIEKNFNILYKEIQKSLIFRGYKKDQHLIEKYLVNFYLIKSNKFFLTKNQMLMLLGNNWELEVSIMKEFILEKKHDDNYYYVFLLNEYKKIRKIKE